MTSTTNVAVATRIGISQIGFGIFSSFRVLFNFPNDFTPPMIARITQRNFKRRLKWISFKIEVEMANPTTPLKSEITGARVFDV